MTLLSSLGFMGNGMAQAKDYSALSLCTIAPCTCLGGHSFITFWGDDGNFTAFLENNVDKDEIG